ncbi:MAG TPA: hypothetical protein VES67_07520 [Vicinamibacterales bacterium]|nr:hypothetical protein [Vicinamibacterales bacterium]
MRLNVVLLVLCSTVATTAEAQSLRRGLVRREAGDRLLRFGLLRSTHGQGSPGPNGFTVGFTQRFGPSH